MAATTALVVGAASAATGVGTQMKAASDAKKAANKAGVDINALDAQTRELALRNARESAALEEQMNPEVAAFRRAANQQLLGNIGADENQLASINALMGRFGQNANTALTDAAIAKAQQDLALGGQLSLDQRNEATRRGLATTGSVTGGLGLGRDIVARDLGLTSQAIEQQRLQNAANLGGLELNREQANNSNFLNQFSALNNYYNNQRALDLSMAQYGQSIAQPVVGLDPASYANLAVGNTNAVTQAQMNAAAASNQSGSGLMSLGGSLMGMGMGAGAFATNATPQLTTMQQNTIGATPTSTFNPYGGWQPSASQFTNTFKNW